jgi:hypothetical protein
MANLSVMNDPTMMTVKASRADRVGGERAETDVNRHFRPWTVLRKKCLKKRGRTKKKESKLNLSRIDRAERQDRKDGN